MAELVKTSLLPELRLPPPTGSDVAGALVRWEPSRPSRTIFATAKQPCFFAGVSLGTRSGATGSKLSYDELHNRVLSITSSDVCSGKTGIVKVFIDEPVKLLTKSPEEAAVVENKERRTTERKKR